MISKFRKINENLYRGSAPSIEDVIFLQKHFGIKKIVSLDEDSGKKIDRASKLLGIEHIMLPIDINRRLTFIKFLQKDIIKLVADGPTYIHCFRGADRTGLAIALYRCKHDHWTAEKAIKEAKSLGMGDSLPPKITKLYEEIIRKSCKSNDDNSAYDIVSNEREDNILSNDNNSPISFAPYLDGTVREYPYSPQYLDYQEQYTNREDYGLDTVVENSSTKNKNTIPQIGGYDTISTGIAGCAPSFIGSGYT